MWLTDRCRWEKIIAIICSQSAWSRAQYEYGVKRSVKWASCLLSAQPTTAGDLVLLVRQWRPAASAICASTRRISSTGTSASAPASSAPNAGPQLAFVRALCFVRIRQLQLLDRCARDRFWVGQADSATVRICVFCLLCIKLQSVCMLRVACTSETAAVRECALLDVHEIAAVRVAWCA
eukprot:g65696.t1